MINNFESEMAISSLLSLKTGYIKKNNYAKRFKKIRLSSSAEIKIRISNDEILIVEIMKVSNAIVDTFNNGNTVYFLGNGAVPLMHNALQQNFSGDFTSIETPLHCNSSFLTAVANDYGYDNVYSRLIDGVGESGKYTCWHFYFRKFY